MMKNYIDATFFHILGIPVNTTDDQVRSSYVILAQRWHPDKHASSSIQQQEHAATQFQLVNRAYIHLKTKPQRDAYIRTLQKIYLSKQRAISNQTVTSPRNAQKKSKLTILGILLFEILWPFVPQSGLGQTTNMAVSTVRNTINTNEASYG